MRLFARFFLLAVLALMVLASGSATVRGVAPSESRPSPALFPAWALPQPSAPPPPGVLEPALARALAAARPDEELRVIVILRPQLAPEPTVSGAASPLEARARLVAALQSVAEHSQAPLRAYLEGGRAAGTVHSYTPFWILNGLAVHALPSAIRALAAHPAVASIRLDHYRQWLPQQQSSIARYSSSVIRHSSSVTSIEWNISRIRADQVWSSLGISGTGVVVAGMDTGVDWLHPALHENYRGYNAHGTPVHTGNWFDAVGGTLYPIDDHGHGTHTMGTAVGQGGIGVAPGARWIGVKVLNSSGYGYDSWIHAGFQWLLAPGGDPAKAPDVVNCSWGSNDGLDTTFRDDLRALQAAGIFPVFASGNSGPDSGTVGSPASLPEAFAVGATNEYDEVAYFSSRGPSPWGEIRPHVVAPGVAVRSSLPGGLYGRMNGTSMAAPHVSGIVALLRSVSPTLTITRTAYLITSTAVPLSTSIPNNDSGWGRVDAFNAVVALAFTGRITGTVARADSGLPIGGATVSATLHGGTGGGAATTNDGGVYTLTLAPGRYDVTGSAFGYEPATVWGVDVVTGTTIQVNFSLASLPVGTLRGQVTDAATGDPITALLSVLGTPVEAVTSTYSFDLPSGAYTLRARRLGYRVVTATAVVTAGEVTTADLALPPAPSILLVDSGGWYHESQIGYFRQALDDLACAYDEWPIRHLPADLPASSDLIPYDIVIWSAPQDAPGYIGAEGAITGYLSSGGGLFLTGQDIGYLDGWWGYAPYYYREYLKVHLEEDSSEVWELDGVQGDLFDGLTLTIAGPGGADNQFWPDVVGITDPEAAAPVLAYRRDGWGGVRVGTCLDYRAVYLSFGFEAINERAARREVMDRSLAWLAADPPTVGLELTPAGQTRTAPPGTTVTHTLKLRHVGQAGTVDAASLSLVGADWATELSQPELTLSPCTSATVVVSVTIPITAGWDERDVLTVTARSSLSPSLVQTAVLTTKAPAPLLLVDDDRWYEQREVYRSAVEAAGLPYDLVETCPAVGDCLGGDGVIERLSLYPMVVWWTGYDWYEPVTEEEEAALAAYLEEGGRLFLSGQDFLYYHGLDPFGRDRLGVLTYTEDVEVAQATGVPEDPVGDGLGPWVLDYPFTAWSDELEPTPGTRVVFREEEGQGIGLARRERGYATAFFSFPFEALPKEGRPRTMERLVGWLSWLGGSTFSAHRGAIPAGSVLTYTLRLWNDGPAPVSASISNTLPEELELIPSSLTGPDPPLGGGPAQYDPAARRIAWEGPLGPGVEVTFTYQVTVATGLPPGAVLVNTARIGLEDQAIHFHRSAVVRVEAPDLSPSAFWFEPSEARPGGVVTGVVVLANGGPANATAVTAIHPLPTASGLVSGSLSWAGGGEAEVVSRTLRWAGPLLAGGKVTVAYQITLPTYPLHPPLYGVVFLEDGVGGRWERSAWVVLEPRRVYLPVALRGFTSR